MIRHIMLSFMSPYKDSKEGLGDSVYYGPNGFRTIGKQTNEPALLYIMNLFALEKYYFFCSNKVKNCLKYDEEGSLRSEPVSHVDFFRERIEQNHSGFCSLMEPLYYNEEAFSEQKLDCFEEAFSGKGSDIQSVQAMAQTIKDYALPLLSAGDKVVLHVDMTGGFRHASMLMLAVVSLLTYSGIEVGKILYTNYDNGKSLGKIEEVTDIHNIMQLIAGAEAFVTYGSVDVLKKYFRNKNVSVELQQLLEAMEGFSDSLKLCRTGIIMANLKKLNEEIKKYDSYLPSGMEEKLFKQLVDRIKQEYASIWHGDNRLQVIIWCLQKGFLQQALTCYTEWIPVIIVKYGIIAPANNNVLVECMNKRQEYVSWEKYLLSQYKPSSSETGAALNGSGGLISCLREYFKTGNEEFKERSIEIANILGSDIERVFYEIEANDKLLQQLNVNEISLKNIREEYPVLFAIVNKIYNGNPNSKPKTPFVSYWLSHLTTKEINKRLAIFKTECFYELLGIDEAKEKALSQKQDEDKTNLQYAKAESRKNMLADGFKMGLLKSVCSISTALQIAYEYNVVRELRNQSNHAMDLKNMPSVAEVKEMLIRSIANLNKCMEENGNDEK